MGRMIDITGKRFGRLVAIEPSKVKATNKSKKWLCKCDCGNTKEIISSSLRFGKTTSCGCWKDEKTSKRFYKHGKSNTLIYNIWTSMKGRCLRKTSKDYPNYGGRGIKICDDWKNDFMTFYNWAISNGYKEGLTIERINPDGNYEPSNCIWLENEKQALNRRNTILIEFKGKKQSIRKWSEELKINYNTLRDYLAEGKTIENILKTYKDGELRGLL